MSIETGIETAVDGAKSHPWLVVGGIGAAVLLFWALSGSSAKSTNFTFTAGASDAQIRAGTALAIAQAGNQTDISKANIASTNLKSVLDYLTSSGNSQTAAAVQIAGIGASTDLSKAQLSAGVANNQIAAGQVLGLGSQQTQLALGLGSQQTQLAMAGLASQTTLSTAQIAATTQLQQIQSAERIAGGNQAVQLQQLASGERISAQQLADNYSLAATQEAVNAAMAFHPGLGFMSVAPRV
jgi:hypothetical protein